MPPLFPENPKFSRLGPKTNPLKIPEILYRFFQPALQPAPSLRTSPSTTPPLNIRSLPVKRNASEIRSPPRSNFIAASIPSACSIISSNNIFPDNCSSPTSQFQTPRTPPPLLLLLMLHPPETGPPALDLPSPLGLSNGKPVMAVPNENDFHSRTRAMDTWDNDSDKLTLAWLQDGDVHGALTLRRPMSVDGGTWMKLLDHDVERINAAGDGWNQKTGHHRWDGLYDVDKEGNPLRPSVVAPVPFESKDAWNSNLKDPADVLKFLMAWNKYAGAIGIASNYAANLDMAGAFDPDRHLFCLSEDVIDGNGIPENLLEHLRKEVYQTARENAMCPSWALRISSGVGEGIYKPVVQGDWEFLRIGVDCGQ